MAPKSVTFRRHDHLVSVLLEICSAIPTTLHFQSFWILLQYSFFTRIDETEIDNAGCTDSTIQGVLDGDEVSGIKGRSAPRQSGHLSLTL